MAESQTSLSGSGGAPAQILVGDRDPVELAPDRATPLTIGSAAGSDIALTESWIAPEHARVIMRAGAHVLVAIAPAILGGAAVTESVLHDGDVIRFPDPTTEAIVTLIYKNPLAKRIAAVQHFATPPGKPRLTIGRVDADIRLDQPLVSRKHAELCWEGDRHVLYDVGSARGTFVNGEPVPTGGRPLVPNDVVQIGTFRLTYDGDSLDTLDVRGAIRLDVTRLARVVGGGKKILDDVTLSIEPCEFIALVGASGAGKSTLMMALCGFERATGGTVSLNGDDLYAGYDAYRSIIGYVPQDDILHRALTVTRALHHAARLRLPRDTADAEIDARIKAVLEDVDMTPHADKRIDQLSGGQRKRVSIACELLADPPLIFLDEPTSGLDPGLERRLMFTLRKLADSGRTVVLVTHATQNITMCDHIVYMLSGNMVYFGPPQQALEFFGVTDFADIYASTDEPDKFEETAEFWRGRYDKSLQHQKYVVERPARAPAQPSQEQRAEKERRAASFALTRGRQLGILCRRYIELMVADRKNLALLLAQAPIIGLLLSLVASPDAFKSMLEAKKLVFMLAMTGVWFGVINAAREICKENPVLRRERLAGLRAGPYLGSKVLVLFGLVLVQSAMLLGVVALRCTMPASGVILPSIIEIYVTIALCGLAGIALGLCISALANTPDKATSLIPIVLVPQVLFAGIMFALHGATMALSYFVSARAGVDALSMIADTNALDSPIPMMMRTIEPRYAHEPKLLLLAWGTILLQSMLFGGIALVTLKRQK